MSAAETMRALLGVGLTLGVDSAGRLTVRGDRSGYTDALKAAVAAHKSDLLAMASAGSAGSAGCFQPHAGTREGNKNSLSENSLYVLVWNDPAEPADPAVAEIASLPVALTRHLPAPCTLVVRFGGRQTASVLTSSAARGEAERRAPAGVQRAVWSPGEYELAAYAVQEGRAFAADVAAWDARKIASRGGWALTPQVAIGDAVALLEHPPGTKKLGGGRVPEDALTLTWGAWLARIGAELLEVVCESSAPARAAAGGEEGEAVTL